MMILDLTDERWLRFLRNCPEASPFHHPIWSDLLAECYGYRPHVLALNDESDQITAGLAVMDVSRSPKQRRWVSLPFTDYHPLLTSGQPADLVAGELVDLVTSVKLDVFELRAGLPDRNHVFNQSGAVRHTLGLTPDPADAFQRFSKMHQRNIRKAEQSGIEVKIGHSASDIQMYYQLHLLTRKRLGAPVQPWRFFHLIARNVVEGGMGFVLSAHANQIPVAAAVFLAWNGVLIYKYGASDPRYWKFRPNNLLFWTAIRWACENGYHTLDWGRTDLDDVGLRDFKRGWGATEEPLTYSVIADHPPKPSSALLHKAMRHVIRRSPPWVCRAIGECWYRYTA